MLQWYALHTKPHKENFVANLLADDGKDVFAPMMKVKPKNPRAAKKRPYFPSYIFVRADLEEEGQNAYRWLTGAHGLVSFDGEAPIVPDLFIQELMEMIVEIEANGLKTPTFEQGETVKIVSGPFAGYEAMFDAELSGGDRVMVLMSYLNDRDQRAIAIEIDVEDIERIKK